MYEDVLRDFQDIEDATYNYGVDDPRLTEGDILRVPDSVLYPVITLWHCISATVSLGVFNCKGRTNNHNYVTCIASDFLILYGFVWLMVTCVYMYYIHNLCLYPSVKLWNYQCHPFDGSWIAAVSLS